MIWSPLSKRSSTQPEQISARRTERTPFVIEPDNEFIAAHIREKIKRLSNLSKPTEAESVLLAGLQKSKPALIADHVLSTRKEKSAAVLMYHAKLGKSIVEQCIGTEEFINRIITGFANQYAQVLAIGKTHADFLYIQKATETTTKKVSVRTITEPEFFEALKEIASVINVHKVDSSKIFIAR